MKSIRLRPDVSIKPVLPEYAPAMLRWMCDPAVSMNLGLRNEPTLERTQEWIARAQAGEGILAYALLLNNRHVGNLVFDRHDDYLASSRLSVYIGEPDARGAGVGLTGMYLGIRQCFETLDFHKIWLVVYAENSRAISAYSRLGFEVEGTLRDEFRTGEGWANALYMGLLRMDFERLSVEESSES